MGGQKVVHCIGPEIIPKNANCQGLTRLRSKDGIFPQYLQWLENKKARGAEKTLYLRPSKNFGIWVFGREGISEWVTGEHILTFDSSCHLPMSWLRGGGDLYWEVRAAGPSFCVWPPPGLTLHCHNYSLLNISQPNSYNSGPSGEMMITPLCRRMHWPRLLTDDLGDNDPEMAARPDPSLLHSQTLAKTRSWEHLRFNEAIESQMLV